MNTASIFSIMSSGRQGPSVSPLSGPWPGEKALAQKQAILDWELQKLNPDFAVDGMSHWVRRYYENALLCCAQSDGRLEEIERFLSDMRWYCFRNPMSSWPREFRIGPVRGDGQ